MIKSDKNMFLSSDHPNLEDAGSSKKKRIKSFCEKFSRSCNEASKPEKRLSNFTVCEF